MFLTITQKRDVMRKTITLLFAFIALYAWQVKAQVFTEDFESGVPGSMTQVYIAGNNVDWDDACSSYGSGVSCPYHGSKSARFYEGSYTVSSTALETPAMDLSSGAYQLKFSHVQKAWGGDQNTLTVQISTDNGSTWDTIVHYANNIDNWVDETILLDSYTLTSTTKFRFIGTDVYGYAVGLDDIIVEQQPACPDPTGLSATVTSPADVELSWSSSSSVTAWEIEYGPTGFSQGSGTVIQTTNNPHTLSALTEGQAYDFYVRSDCGGGTYSNWAGPYTWVQNDVCVGAPILTVYSQGGGAGNEINASTTPATDSGQHPSCDNTGTNYDLWYRFTAPSSGHVKVITGGAKGNRIEAAIYNSCGGAELDCQDQSTEKTFTGLNAGQTYILQVWHDSYYVGDFTIVLEDVLYVEPEFTLNTVPDCNNNQFSIEVNVTDLGGSSSVTISDDQGSSTQQLSSPGTVTFGPYAFGTTVNITVTSDQDSNVSASDSATMAGCPPANDDCQNAIEVATLPYNNSQDATFATNNNGNITTCGYGMNDGVWYKFTVGSANGDITIEVTPSGWDAEVAVYTGSCGSFTCVTYADSGGSGTAETVTFTPTDNTTYYVNVGHYAGSSDGSEGSYTISITGSSTLNAGELTQADFSFYPNPTTGVIRWNASQSVNRVQVTNLTGQVLMNVDNPAGNSMDISRLPQGVYLLRVQIGDKQGTYRLIKE